MDYNKMNQSHGLSYDETMFLGYQKVPKVKIVCFYSKEGGLDWLEDSPSELPPFRPILSATDIPTYMLAKFLLTFLTPSTTNEYAVIDSFHLAEEICQQDSNLHMASLDVDSLFTNIPLNKTIKIYVDNLYNDNENIPNIPKHDFGNLLNIATKESFFLFNNKYYKEVEV